jgi:hypothetical protein
MRGDLRIRNHPHHLTHLNHRVRWEEEGFRIKDRLADHLVGTREALPGDHHHHHHLHLLLLRTLHQVLQGSVSSLSYQHQPIKRSPTSRRQRTSLRQRNGIVLDDRPSSILRKIDGISTMTKRLFDSC